MTHIESVEAIKLREEVAHAQAAAHDAITRLDIASAIAFCRSLRSATWRAERAGIDLADPESSTNQEEAH